MKTFIALSLVLGVAGANAATAKTNETKASQIVAEAQMQGSAADVEITRKIRDRITNDDSLSTSAQNVTIVTKDNAVWLKGSVNKQEEIRKIRDIASEYAGSRTIRSDLKINQL